MEITFPELANKVEEHVVAQNGFNAQATWKLNQLVTFKAEKEELVALEAEIPTIVATSPTILNLTAQIAALTGSISKTVSGKGFPATELLGQQFDLNALFLGLIAGQTLEPKTYLVSFSDTGSILFNGTETQIENKGDSILVDWDGAAVTGLQKFDIDAVGSPTATVDIPAFVGMVNIGQDQYQRDAAGLPIPATDANGQPILDANGLPTYVVDKYFWTGN